MSPIDDLIEHLKGVNPYGRGTEAFKLWSALKQLSDAAVELSNTKVQHTLENPIGAINGNNKNFLLSSVPATSNNLLMGFKNGLLLQRGIDFNIENRLIIMTTAPAIGNVLQFLYLRRIP